MKVSKEEIQAIHTQSQAWAEMRSLLPELKKIVMLGPLNADHKRLMRRCVNLVCGEIHMRIANELKDNRTQQENITE